MKTTTKLFTILAVFATLLFVSCKKATVTATPVASFTITPNDTIYDVETFTLTNTTTGADSYVWNFGDGTTSTLENPTKSYGDFDNDYELGCFTSFTITLTATKDGKSSTATKTVVVNFCS